jgi:putative restriction endonuclease
VIREFLADEDWDAPFFKRLAHNDTGRARGHQAGFVLPKDLRKFFPTLDRKQISAATPTSDRALEVELYLGIRKLTDAIVRYQFQTWGGTRHPESRITDNLGPVRALASKGDLLLFQRRSNSLDRFRLILIARKSAEFAEIDRLTDARDWGTLFPKEQPVTQVELRQAISFLDDLADQPFSLLKPKVPRVETRQMRIARSSVFPKLVGREYERRCCVSGIVVLTPPLLYEAQAAHIVPLSKGGTDDIRNGLSLSQTLHWAFDRGLFGVMPNRRIYLPRRVEIMKENSFLKQFRGIEMAETKTSKFRAHKDALAWHFKNLVKQWE